MEDDGMAIIQCHTNTMDCPKAQGAFSTHQNNMTTEPNDAMAC